MTITSGGFTVVDDGTDYERWLEARRTSGTIGASQTAGILGLSPYSTPRDVWESMQPGAEPMAENRFTTWGTRLEAVIAEGAQVDFRETLGTVLPTPGLLVSKNVPFISATPDRLNADAAGDVWAVTEVKNGGSFTRDNWFEPYSTTPDVPAWYETQVQQQMWVRGVDRGFITALIGGNELILREVHLNEKFMEILIDEVEDWRDKYLLGETPPPLTDRDDFSKVTAVPGKRIDATQEILALVAERNILQPQASALEKRDKELKNTIRAFMGDATDLVDPSHGHTIVTWRQGADKTAFDLTQFALDHPHLYSEYLAAKKGSRTMTFTKVKG